jgi:hypothetical protein
VLENVAGGRAVQITETAQIVIELVLSGGRENIVDLIRWAWHERDYSRVFALAPGFARERLQ